MPQQQIVLFRVSHGGVFGQKESSNLEEINALLAQGWRVVQMSPTSSPSVHVGAFTDVFALVVLEKD
jgi:tRNA G18 (ribose-2'-O)-methylase SpoU